MEVALTIVRHGETMFNKKRIIQGQGIDTPLSDEGLRQARAAGDFLADIAFTHVYSSDLQRALQTAEAILERNKRSCAHKIEVDSRLRERSYGLAEGKPVEELRAMARAVGQACPEYNPPGAENLQQLKQRVLEFFHSLCDSLAPVQFCSGELPLTINGNVSSTRKPQTVESMSSTTQTEISPLETGSLHQAESQNEGPGGDLGAEVLVVSHGGTIRQWIQHLVHDLSCAIPPGTHSRLNVVSPNTGLSRFLLVLPGGGRPPTSILCIYLHHRQHLQDKDSPTVPL
uniref:fructose-2,6-bisphosphatase TIGAR n=1 Tax=Myxine glutinosa TaxID=7769 RepID=UPI00358EEDDE